MTSRTDAARFSVRDDAGWPENRNSRIEVIPVEVSYQLERELATANERLAVVERERITIKQFMQNLRTGLVACAESRKEFALAIRLTEQLEIIDAIAPPNTQEGG